MGNISSSIDLAKFKNSVVIKHGKNKDVECLLIPLAQNGLKNGEYGVVFETVGFSYDNKGKGKSTHIIKQSFPKDVLDKMSDDEKKAMPIFGNHVNWDEASGVGNNSAPAQSVESDEDLPF